ncbi:MAG: epoxide hydrolase [Oscillospiraceae bacterium]|nr:epoxide hydrolase [Oscillospiraceae bacterium]
MKVSIHFEEKQIEDLRNRICCTRVPKALKSGNWELGVDDEYMECLLSCWRHRYDWTKKEKELNQYPQFTCELDGMTIYYFHIPGSRKDALPLLLTHGWPDSFLRYAKIFPLLSEFDLVVPSLPGFAFSTLPPQGFINNTKVADLWHRLMTEILGYKEYAASGGDMGRGVTCYLAAKYPQEVKGIHLTDVGMAWDLINAPDEKLSPAELDYKRRANDWLRTEAAYINIHSTKPQTLAYLLSDSPAGMAAWITEKYHAWSDWELLSMDDLLDCLTLYWMTNTACTSIRAYHGNTFTLPPLGKITVPTAIAAFPYDVLPVPMEWVQKNYPVIQYTKMPRGGHFTALEQPERFAANVSQFMNLIS